MIVIHIGMLDDSARLYKMYENLANIIVLRDTAREKVEAVLKQFPHEKVMLLGHGSRDGLWASNRNRFIIDEFNVDLLKKRTVIGIWCYASEFADRYGLHGFFTSMFISNIEEAIIMLSFCEHESEEITKQLDLFSYRIREFLLRNEPMNTWVEYLQSKADCSIPFVRFNYEALTYYD